MVCVEFLRDTCGVLRFMYLTPVLGACMHCCGNRSGVIVGCKKKEQDLECMKMPK